MRLERIPASAAARLDARVELIDQRGHRQRGTVAARLGDRHGEVLAHPVDGEAEVELVRRHRLAAIVHLPGLRRALADHVEDLLDVEPGAHGEVDALGESLHQAGDADLVDHLGQLPRAGAAHQRHRARVDGEHGFGAREGVAHRRPP